MKRIMLSAGALFVAVSVLAQNPKPAPESGGRPKLVVGIVVDQMRYDFICRFWRQYGEGGFKRLIKEGAFYRNAEYDYVPTVTAAGHASIFTGATPASHGIVGNEWFDRAQRKKVGCVADGRYEAVGIADATNGQASPKNLLATTVTDELRLASNLRSRVIGISLKDRAAILPAGHLANGAYWFDDQSGHWITSTYYTNQLPPWVMNFNGANRADSYLQKVWTANGADYSESLTNGNPYLKSLSTNANERGFPYDLRRLSAEKREGKYEVIRYTPFGNSLTEEFAEAAITNERLGKHDFPDFLTINFASTDYAGHKFGPRSGEVEDTYLQFDKTLAKLLKFLDNWIGKKNVIVFLTADHGVADVPGYSRANRLPGGIFPWAEVMRDLTNRLEIKYGGSYIAGYINQQIYLDTEFIESHKLDKTKIEDDLRDWLIRREGVADVISVRNLKREAGASAIYAHLANGIYPSRSGDLAILLQSGWMEVDEDTATTHGTPYQYDTHVPLLFWGWCIPHLISDEPVTTTEIAPTLSQLLRIQFPSASINQVLPGLCRRAR